MARRGVEFVVFGDVGVISDAAVARHRLCKRGACVVDERIRRDAGRREAMVNVGVCKVCNEERVLGAATISHQLFDSALEIPATAPPLFLRKRRNSFVTNVFVSQSELFGIYPQTLDRAVGKDTLVVRSRFP